MTDIPIPAEALEAAAMAAMKDNWCGYTVGGKNVLCDDPVCEGLLDPYGKPMKHECSCRSMATAALRAALANWPGMELDEAMWSGGTNFIVLPLTEKRMSNSPEIPDGSTIVHRMIPPEWDDGPYSVASEIKRVMASVVDHGSNIDSDTVDGQAHLWVTIGGTEYFITVENASGQSKNNPLMPGEQQ